MTSPSSSYVFYEEFNPEKLREEGVKLVRLSVKENELVASVKELVRANSGGLYEKTLHTNIYSVQENSHGTKYLKILNRTPSGEFKDVSLSGTTFEFPDELDKACFILLTGTLCSWFGVEDDGTDRENEFLYPALRGEPYFIEHGVLEHCDTDVMDFLAELQASGVPVIHFLRESESLEEFLCAVFPCVETQEDIELLYKRPTQWFPVASLQLGDTLTSLRQKYGEAKARQFLNSFSSKDRDILRFMLKHSTMEERQEAVSTLMALSHLHRTDNPLAQRWSYYSEDVLDFNEIPHDLRLELADALRAALTPMLWELRQNPKSPRLKNPVIETSLEDIMRYWYATRIFQPRLQTTLTVDDMKARFVELYGQKPWDEDSFLSEFKWIQPPTTGPFCCFKHTLKTDPQTGNLLALLNRVAFKERPRVIGKGFNAYIDGDYLYRNFSDIVYSLEEVLTIIEAGTAAVDEALTKLGRPTTPENRTAYLRCDVQERQFRDTWKLYDWGVTDLRKLLALKKNGVKKEADVRMYNSLPDEMFYEFLATMSGEEHTTAVTIKWV